MKRFFRSFRQLRWKLTLSYALTAIASFLLVFAVVFGGLLLWLGTHIPAVILNNLSDQAAQSTPYLATATQDPALLTAWLKITAINDASQNPDNDPSHYHPIFLTMVNAQGNVLASAGSQSLLSGTPMQVQLNPQNAAQLRSVLRDHTGATSTAEANSDGTLVAIAPVMEHGRVQGALVLKIIQPDAHVLFLWFFSVTSILGTAALVIAVISGPIFGYITARGVIKRLKKLSVAADSWGRGDFAARATDTSQDELGQMAHQLNQMAEQLQNLLETRQQLATLEERNRLARDLHDSVKQQIFAVSMQIAATRILLTRDVKAADERLDKTEKLVQQAQQELTSLIRELRPVALEGKGLVAALRELLPQWSQQSDIVANLQVEGTQTLPLTVEEALFRIVQEALSNVARHSQATLVQLTLNITSETVTLSIQDNGLGFDSAQPEHRGVGLFSMQERIKPLGGETRIESTCGLGTCILVHCPRLSPGIDEATPEHIAEKMGQSGR